MVILGTGPIEDELKGYAKDFSNVEFKGFQTGKALKDYVKNSKCVVLPSEWYENGPYSAMEAMAMGKPLIVSDNGGLPELVEDGVNGYVYSTNGSVEVLSECIRKIDTLTNEAYMNMSSYSTKKAKELFEPMLYVKSIEKLYYNIKEQ